MTGGQSEREFAFSRRRLLSLAAGALAREAAAQDGQPFRISIGQSSIEVFLPAEGLDLASATLLAWVKTAARAVAAYYGGFPVSHASVTVRAIEGRAGVLRGATYAGIPPRTVISVGEHATPRQLDNDWTMTREFVHLAFPRMARQHHWLEEGQATYIEPVARAQIGALPPERVWGDMLRHMHQGLPGPGDRGLDFTPARGNWGGALYCLLADVGIRQRTGNRAGLEQALRGVLAAGGNIESDWPIEDALKAADAAVQVPVMTELYVKMKDKPYAPDLNELWRRLGVAASGHSVALRDDAPLAGVRKAITRTQ